MGSRVLFALFAVVLALPAAAQDTFYGHVGASYGRARLDADCPGVAVDCDRTQNAWKVFAGSRFNKWFGGEISYLRADNFKRGATEKKKLASKACAIRTRLPRFIGLETPSTPTPKYPRKLSHRVAKPGGVLAHPIASWPLSPQPPRYRPCPAPGFDTRRSGQCIAAGRPDPLGRGQSRS